MADNLRNAYPDDASPEAIVVGASAGAVEALSVIFPRLPQNYPLPILVVVHMPPDQTSFIAEVFQAKSRVKVKEAEDKEPVLPGTIYFAPPNYHLLLERDRRLSLSSEERVLFSRPSIDVLFETAADVYCPNLVGIILTGANQDGARGLRAICSAGGVGIVQRPDLAQVRTMPQAALDACQRARPMTLDEIASFLLTLQNRSQTHA